MSALIGALRVVLGLDSAGFERGASEVERRAASLQRRIAKYGKSMSDFGAKLSLSVTAPLAAISASVLGLADDAKQLRNAASLAGEGFEDFQRHAYAAKSVGIEYEKLGDILKDTQDKIGDFTANGGGEMADFFENIAPKVGVTAAMFKDLSGKDALQLYYNSLIKAGVSQKELVFYMEAIADEGSGLIPLLKDNGKALKELGANAAVISEKDAEGLKKYTDAQTALGNAVQKLKIAIANSGLIEFATRFVEKIADIADRVATLPPGVQKIVVAVAAIVAVAGPVLIVLGQLVQGFSAFLAIVGVAGAEGGVLVAARVALAGVMGALGPLLPILAALAAAGALIYANWDKIAPALEEFWSSAQKTLGPEITKLIDTLKTTLTELWNGPLGAMIRATVSLLGDFTVAHIKAFGPVILTALKLLVQGLTNFFATIGDGIRFVRALFEGDWRTALESAVSIFDRLFGGIPAKVIGWMAQMVNGIREWVVDRLGAVWDTVTGKLEAVKKAFFGVYDAVVGHSYIPDMVDGIADQMDRLDAEMVDKAKVAAKSTGEAFRALAEQLQPILDRLFPEAARLREYKRESAAIAASLKAGQINSGTADEAQRRLRREYYGLPLNYEAPNVATALDPEALRKQVETMSGFAWLASDNVEAANVRIVKSFKDMAEDTIGALQAVTSAIKGGGFLDILGSVIGLGLQLGSMGLFGKKVAGSINSANKIPGYANGTSFHPGGLAVVGERGPELVSMSRGARVIPNHKLGGQTNNYFSGNLLTPEFWAQIQAGDISAASAGARGGAALARQSGQWALR